MIVYIIEFLDMVFICSVLVRKLDKLIILRMAVFYMKFLRGIGNIFIDGIYKLFFFIDQVFGMYSLESLEFVESFNFFGVMIIILNSVLYWELKQS